MAFLFEEPILVIVLFSTCSISNGHDPQNVRESGMEGEAEVGKFETS